MANDLAQNPWVLDTAGTVVSAGQPVVIDAVKIVGLEAPGDAVAITDGNDNQFWAHTAGVADESSNIEAFTSLKRNKRTLNGLKLTIDSGKLYVWFG